MVITLNAVTDIFISADYVPRRRGEYQCHI